MHIEKSESTGFLSTERLAKGPWQAFERAISRLLAHRGWEIQEVVGGSGDHGADILAAARNEDQELVECIYQAKFSEINKPLSANIVDDVYKAMNFYEIKKGVCVSNRILSETQMKRLEVVRGNGYDIDTFLAKDLIKVYDKIDDWASDPRELKPYQVEAIVELQSAFLRGDQTGLICLATGLGKTFVAAKFLQWIFENNPEFNVLILANTKNLIEQFDRAIWISIPKWKATHLLYESEKPSFYEGITLSTFQSFPGFYKTTNDFHYDIVIVDEAHHAAAGTYSKVLKGLNPKFLLGLTATPFRMDERSVSKIFGPPLVYYNVYTALNKGFLAKVEYQMHNDNIDEEWVSKNSKRGHTIKQLNKKIFLPERDDAICEKIAVQWKEKKLERGIIFCNSSEHAERIEKILQINFHLPVWSLTTRIKEVRERARRLREFRIGRTKILTCFDMLNEGIDIPDVDYIAFLRVTHSRAYFLQQLGRGLRYKEGKTLLVDDYVSDLRRIKRVKVFRDEYEDSRKNEIEDLFIKDAFRLTFTSEQTTNFLNLVTKDISEEMDDDAEVYLASV